MHWKTILRITSLLVVIFSFNFIPPLGVSLFYGDGHWGTFGLSWLIVAVIGVLFWLPVRGDRKELMVRDGFLVVALFWTVLGLVGSLPFMFGLGMTATDAVFESISGFTTTGATVILGLDELPRSILYYRQQLQWLGGMGVVVLAVAILPMLGIGGMQLYKAEVSRVTADDKLTPRLMHTARALWAIYLTLTIACALAYWLAGMTPFDAIGHAYTTVATAGYSTHDASMGYFDSVAIELIAIVFMLLGGINFALHFLVWRSRDVRVYLRTPEARVFLGLFLAATMAIAGGLAFVGTYDSVLESLRYAAFQTVAVLTTTGYGTATFAEWPLYIPLVLASLSFIGGCAGSTAGGMKVVRIMLLFKQGAREVNATIHPHAVYRVKLGDRAVPEQVVQAVWGFYTVYILAALVLTGLNMAMGLDMESAFGATIASLNLLGPGLGEVATTFAHQSDPVKWMASFAMLMGRLEVFTLLILFTFAFWRN
ncbi:trk system potassium uptake protein TrkH [Alkalispirillum mobile]|uniref:Trk system potassium uptake protein n=1 Tax=Alkalispirillum mobile TaxID=85925 RepID=A0A498CFF1_9GAMM|nr:TrkH family potassium uptake protein [Alkalispirillum mobile]RLK51068.1 trk system potassium uptake protein TrkH [Alkalispirillum mobile]